MIRRTINAIVALCALAWPTAAGAQEPPVVLRDGLAIPPVGRSSRGPVHTDAIEAEIVAGRWRFPVEGQTVALPGGRSAQWTRIQAAANGAFSGPALRGGYVAIQVAADKPAVRLLEASGHSMVYVNGEPRAGDVYSTGWTILPVALKVGQNTLLFSSGRGSLSAKLTAPASEALFNPRDLTLPDLVVGEPAETMGAVIVVNASEKPLAGWAIRCSGPGLAETVTRVPAIPPLTIRKVGFRIRAAAPPEAGSVDATLALSRGGDQPSDTAAIKLRVRNKAETRKITFVSAIDGSVQYYAVNPASTTGAAQHGPDRQSGHTGPNEPAGPGASGGKRGGAGLALFLTLHGAGVEAIGQADAYAPKSWGNIVAPTNRRPYGFDWEDWGRLDALEVLDLAKARFKPDPARIYLTGHSMGGHGTWHIGVTYPDKFAAIGPSAGWISLFSYAGATRAQNASEMQSLLLRPMQPSDTLSLERNTVPEGVYILHGDADDNVPVTEARQMKRELAAFHPDVQSWEQPGAGHWWSTDQHPAAGERFGAACVDWKPMFDLFASRRLPADPDVRAVEFYTADPGVSAWCHWAGILAQEHAFKVSAIQLSCDPAARTFSGTTDNVLRLELKTAAIAGPDPLIVRIDGQTISNIACPGACGPIWLEKRGGSWTAAGRPASSDKSPERCGPFKQAFRNRMVFVYGTKGTPDENAWAYARARFDAETFWYRGNGAVDVVADTAFHAGTDRDRSVVLYGNAETNGAWAALLRDSPVTVTRTAVGIGERKLDGADVACLFVRPRPGSATALVAAVSGTGLEGMRLTERLPYFSSGVEYPDFVAVRSSMLTDGASGVPAAGFFGPDWSVAKGEFAWQ